MSGPYDQQALGQVSGFNAASNNVTNVTSNRRTQRGESSTSLSSAASANAAKGNVAVVGGGQQQQQQFVLNGSGYGGASLGQSGASFGSVASGPRRPGRFHRETIRLPDQCAGQVRQVRQRLPTPEPDTIERVYLQRAGQEVIEEITEIPMTPPPRVQERTVVEPAGPPQVIKRVIRVPARSGGGAIGGGFQAGGNLMSAGSYGNVQQAGATTGFGGATTGFGGAVTGYGGASTGFGGAVGGGFGGVTGGFGAATGVGGFGSYGGSFGGQQAYGGFGGQHSQPIQPPVGVHPAFCFQV